MAKMGLMNGVGKNTFAPDSTLSRAMVVTILYRLEGEPAAHANAVFTDVGEGWYHDAVYWAANKGIVNGNGDGTFAPDAPVTREQLAAILYRYAKYCGMDVSVGENTNLLSYEDAFSVSAYAMLPLQWSCGSGVLTGEGAYLNPAAPASRALVASAVATLCKQ